MTTDFSIIIPSFNRPGSLSGCLSALAALDYPAGRFEVIVVDDGSDAPIGDAFSSWRERLPLRFMRQANGGPGAARNHGAAAAGGRYLVFTDDDCRPQPGWLEALSAALERNPGALVGGRTLNALPDNPYATTSQAIVDVVYDYYNADPDNATFFATNNMALPADRFRGLDGFDPAFRTSEDRDLCDRWAASGGRLVYAADARVEHAHQLGFTGFVRQHFNYGRGARRFQLAVRGREPQRSSLKGSFYRELPGRIWKVLRGREKPLRLWLLMLLWQCVNTAGFLYETAAGRGEPPR